MGNAGPKLLYEVMEEKIWIPLKDGIKLAGTLYRPKSPGKFPAILEYIPYRKDDLTVPSDRRIHSYFAKRGYVGVRVDIRGTGSSEGVSENEYVLQEQLDACEVIEWLAEQEWCTGDIGMWGISYGGYTAVQAASHNPPHLKAIVPMYFTDDNYITSDHFRGGCVKAAEFLWLGMVAGIPLPPDPQYFEGKAESWEEMWHKRLEQYQPWTLEWLNHQTNDSYWRKASVNSDYESIKCPVFMFGGWGDYLTNATLRMLDNLKVPKKAIIGPWVHMYPDSAYPAPNIDYLHEMVRWWDYWLKGENNGVMDEQSLAIYVQRDKEPVLFPDKVEGYWRYEKAWPLEDGREVAYYFHSNSILDRIPPTNEKETCDQYKYKPDVGIMGSIWLQGGCRGLEQEQSLDEAFSLTYTSEPLKEDLEILGCPQAKLYIASSAKNTAFAVTLTEVDLKGESNPVTDGILNASHRSSHEEPEPLDPGQIYELNVELDAMSWVFKKGQRIRVSVTSSDWPAVWPLPEPAVNRVYHDKAHNSRVILPVIPSTRSSKKPAFKVPSKELVPNVEVVPERPSLKIIRDVTNKETIVEVAARSGFKLTDRGLSCKTERTRVSQVSLKDPSISSARGEYLVELRYSSGFTVSSRARGMVSSNKEQFLVNLSLNIEVNGQPYFERNWLKTYRRNFA